MSQVNKHLKEAKLIYQAQGTPFAYDLNYSYQVEITSYGVKIDSKPSTVSDEYTYGGQQIQLMIADVKPRWDQESSPTKLSDDVVVLATCPRKIYIDGTRITPIGSDMLTFMIYGWNATPIVDSSTGALSYSLGIQNSSSVLRSTNAINVDAVSNATAAAYSLNRVSSKIATQLDITDVTPPTPYIRSDTMYVKE